MKILLTGGAYTAVDKAESEWSRWRP